MDRRHRAGDDWDWVVVGCGLTGASFARSLADSTDARVLVVDRRDAHRRQRVRLHRRQFGVRVQRYGAHIFHTSSEPVWQFLSRFTDWYPYRHRVMANVDGQLVPLPFNFTSLRSAAAGGRRPAAARTDQRVPGPGPGSGRGAARRRAGIGPRSRRVRLGDPVSQLHRQAVGTPDRRGRQLGARSGAGDPVGRRGLLPRPLSGHSARRLHGDGRADARSPVDRGAHWAPMGGPSFDSAAVGARALDRSDR